MAWSAYLIWWRGSLDIRPAEVARPAAETVIDFQSMKMQVPAPFELLSFKAEVSGPGDNDYLHYEEHLFTEPDQARQALDRELEHRRNYLPSLGHGQVVTHQVMVLGRPAVLAVEYGMNSWGHYLMCPYLYVAGDRGYLIIKHNHYAFLETAGEDPDQAALAEREGYLALTGELLARLGWDGGLEALGRLSREPDSPFRPYLTLAHFRLPGRESETAERPFMPPGFVVRRADGYERLPERKVWSELFRPIPGPQESRRSLDLDGRTGREVLVRDLSTSPALLFAWDEDPPPDRHDRRWQIYLLLDDPDQAPAWLGLWRRTLETVEFPEGREN